MSLHNRKSMEPWIKDDVAYYPHQVEGIRQMARMRNVLLADDMGLGKSLQAMTVYGVDVARGYSKRPALVVCPPTLKGNWADELDKFTGFDYLVLPQNRPVERSVMLAEFGSDIRPKFLIVNYEQVVAHLKELNAIRFDTIIFDEAHYIKNYKSKRTKAALSLVSRRSLLLTGTPMLNFPNELWPLLHRIDTKRFDNYWQFVNRYVAFGGFGGKQMVGVKNVRGLRDAVQDYMIRRLKKDVLKMDEPLIIERRVDLTPQQKKLYDQAREDLVLPKAGSTEQLEVSHALTQFLRLKQICGTTLPFSGEDHSAKLDLCIEDDLEIAENGDKIVIFSEFLDVMSCYISRMSKQTIHGRSIPIFRLDGQVPIDQRQLLVKQWEAVKGPAIIVCQTKVAGVGLNMVAAHDAAFIDQLFVPGLNRQAIDRLHRIGQTEPVRVRQYIARGTIENRVQQILRMKMKLNNDIIEEDDTNFQRQLLEALKESL